MMSIAKPEPKTCWYCGEPKKATAWRNGRAVCVSCEGFMRQGVICIGVQSAISHDVIIDKIYRDGNWCVVSAEEYTRRFRGAVPFDRFEYIDRATWTRAGLPKFGKHGASHTNDNANKPEQEEQETA